MTDKANEPNLRLNGKFNPELFFELSADLLCIAGYDGYFKRVNPAVSNLLGYTYEELFAKPIDEFVYLEDRAITSQSRNNLKKSIPLLNFENRYVTKSGELVWLSWTSMPVESEQLVYAIAKNITHKKKIEEDRNALLTDLTRINNELKQLNYTTSHDLRSPVNNLLLGFNLLDVSKIQDAETLEFINILQAATEGLKKTLNNYVDVLSQKNDLHIHMEELDLNDSLNAVLRSLSSLMKNSKAIVNVDFASAAKINFNKSYLESIFLNLITNSIKYALPDTCPVISMSSQKIDSATQLIFSDEGLGFDMDMVKDRVFGFHQKFHNHTDSKGIGLYLVYNHITSLGGHITLESEPNKGAKFVITFMD